MSRINRVLAAVLSLLLVLSCFAQEDIISSEDIVSDTANYKTVEVKSGTFRKTQNASASVYFTNRTIVRYEGAAARFVDYHVKKNDEVKVGDLLATFYVERDEISIARMNLDIERSRSDFETGKENYRKQLEEKDKQILASSDPYTREIRRLEKEKIAVTFEKYVYETENSILDKEKNLVKLIETYENTNVYSAVNGIVSELTFYKDNQYVYDGAQLMVIYDPTEFLFRIANGSGMRYNMEVTVSVGNQKNRVSAKGRVIASPMALPGSSGPGDAYVLAKEEDADGEVKNLNSPSVSYDAQYLDNVFVVDRKAVTLFGGKNYVYKLSPSGMVSKRYVNYVFGNSATGALIIDGLNEGEKLIID